MLSRRVWGTLRPPTVAAGGSVTTVMEETLGAPVGGDWGVATPC